MIGEEIGESILTSAKGSEVGRPPSRVTAEQSACPAREHVGAYGHTPLPPCRDCYPLGESTSFPPNPLMSVSEIVDFPRHPVSERGEPSSKGIRRSQG
jgi:hypothetical protein